MAPRRRTRIRSRSSRPGTSRMDAAVDNMIPYGFSEELVKKTVNELLELYGGEDAWLLIEEGGYTSVLLDALLAAQNKTEEEEGEADNDHGPGGQVLEDVSTQQNGARVPHSPVISGPSPVTEPLGYQIITTSSHTNSIDLAKYLSSHERGGKTWKDIGLSHSSTQNEVAGATRENDQESPRVVADLPISPSYSPPELSYSPPVGSDPVRRRKPFYGWIGDDDHDEDDIIVIPPAESFSPQKGTPNSIIKRKTRWDVTSEDM